MGRPASAQPKAVVVATRLSALEAAYVDSVRGSLTRSEWVRWMLLQHKQGK